MAKTIYKFPLLPSGEKTRIAMPQGASILALQVQRDTPCIWALVDPKASPVERTFHIAGTGHRLPDLFDNGDGYVGTFQVEGGQFVFHLFDYDAAHAMESVRVAASMTDES